MKATDKAKRDYETICAYFEKMTKIIRHDEELSMSCIGRGDDFPIFINFMVTDDGGCLATESVVAPEIKKEKLLKLLYIMNLANRNLVLGNFEYKEEMDAIIFRNNFYLGSHDVDEKLMGAITSITSIETDRYNDIFIGLNDDKIEFDDVVKWFKGNK